MAYRLRKLHPPYGNETHPLFEYTYSEQVKVVDGICEVENPTARDFLLKRGYALIETEDPVFVGVNHHESIPPPSTKLRPSKHKKKKRRR